MNWEESATAYAKFLLRLRDEYNLDDLFIVKVADSTKQFAANYHTAIKNGELPDDYFTQNEQKATDMINGILEENGEEI